jgi:hypothetical protein
VRLRTSGLLPFRLESDSRSSREAARSAEVPLTSGYSYIPVKKAVTRLAAILGVLLVLAAGISVP